MSVDVLIVDDLESFRALLRARLEGLGCRVVGEAQNSKEGVEAFRRLRPRLCTLDLTMGDSPDFTAPDLFRKIRQENPETAIIVVSVSPRHANAPQFLAEGAIASAEKAFMDFDKLPARLELVFPELRRSGGATNRLRRP